MKRICLLSGVLLLLNINQLCSQNDDQQDRISYLLEIVAEENDTEYDYSYLQEAFEELLDYPANINQPEDQQKLAELLLLDDIRLAFLREYIRTYGEIRSIYELQYVDGFDRRLAYAMEPLIHFKESKEKAILTPSKMLKYGNHVLIMRYGRVLQKAAGYKPLPDSEWIEKPNSRYLGSPDKLYLRYQYKLPQKIKLSLLAEKDAGERLFGQDLPDTLQKLLIGKNPNGFDFYSGSLYYEGRSWLRKVVLGDYHVSFGQGLCMWSGFSMGRSSSPNKIKKYASHLRPSSSANEYAFLRGGGLEMAYKNLGLTLFYSASRIDGNITILDSSRNMASEVSSLQKTGYHRTIGELQDRRSLQKQLMGAHLGFSSYTFRLGISAVNTWLSAELKPDDAAYRKFEFRGKDLFNLSADFDILLGRSIVFGELARSENGGMAGLLGVSGSIESIFDVSFLYRNYARNYQNLSSAAFGENSGNRNEEGIYLGASTRINRNLSLAAYVDLFRFRWLRFRTDAPSKGKVYFFELLWEEEKYRISFRYRLKQKENNFTGQEFYIPAISAYTRENIRLQIKYEIGEQWQFASRIDVVNYQDCSGTKPGYLIYQDIAWFTRSRNFDLHFRYALFDARDYQARLYAYEHNVLYAFSIPAYYGKGCRLYLLLDYKINQHFECWARFAITRFDDRDVISSGLDEIEGYVKSDLKIQVVLKF